METDNVGFTIQAPMGNQSHQMAVINNLGMEPRLIIQPDGSGFLSNSTVPQTVQGGIQAAGNFYHAVTLPSLANNVPGSNPVLQQNFTMITSSTVQCPEATVAPPHSGSQYFNVQRISNPADTIQMQMAVPALESVPIQIQAPANSSDILPTSIVQPGASQLTGGAVVSTDYSPWRPQFTVVGGAQVSLNDSSTSHLSAVAPPTGQGTETIQTTVDDSMLAIILTDMSTNFTMEKTTKAALSQPMKSDSKKHILEKPQKAERQLLVTICSDDSQDKKKYRCKICEKQFSNISNGIRHVRIHMKLKMFACNVCDAKFVQSSHLRRHERTHTGAKPYQCSECDKSFSAKENLTFHMWVHTKDETCVFFSCERCSKKFHNARNYRTHVQHHKLGKTHACNLCTRKYYRRHHLFRHKKSAHPNSCKCKFCKEEFEHNVTRIIHERKCGKAKKFPPGTKVLTCDTCQAVFRSASNLKRHKRCHTGEKPFPCDVCGATFAQSNQRKRHALRHTGEKRHVCDQCGKRYAGTNSLRHHKMAAHLGEKPYECIQCPMKFSAMRNLLVHELVHSDKRPHKCLQCGATFKRTANLKRHVKTVHHVDMTSEKQLKGT